MGGEKMNICKKELEEIRDWLVKEKLDEQTLDWLKERRVGLFEGEEVPENLEKAKNMLLYPGDYNLSLVNSSKEKLSFTIQDILDALAKKDRFGYTPRGNLSKKSLIELAKNMGIKKPEEMKRFKLLEEVKKGTYRNS